MRVAISARGSNLDAQVAPRFGRCHCFLVVDPATDQFEVLDNEAAMMSGGAGIKAAQMVARSGAEVVITGTLGPNAADTLSAAGVKTYLRASGTVREVLEQYKAGQLQESKGPTVEKHFGTGGVAAGTNAGRSLDGGRGMGRGMGTGRGMGRGIGRGMGLGRGAGRGRGIGRGMGGGRSMSFGMGRGYSSVSQPSSANDLEELKERKDQLQKQMKQLEECIRKLEKKKDEKTK